MNKINTKVLSGFMELTPGEQMEFDRIKLIIESIFKRFGYSYLDTPLIERTEVLLAKGGDETDHQMYFVSNGLNAEEKSSQALRYDLTVPLARYVVEHFHELVFPFKRSQMGKVFRGERAQKGRFREFYQYDIDVIGRDELSVYYDAEIPSIIYNLFKELELGKFTIRINNRKILNGLFLHLEISESSSNILAIVDKAEKISDTELVDKLRKIGLSSSQIESIKNFMGIKGDTHVIFAKLEALGIENDLFKEGVSELKEVANLMSMLGVEKDYFAVDLSIARGLDYYTGTVYETIIDDARIGSVCSGGRYENLAGHFTNEKLPGVGISLGLTRLFYQLQQAGILNLSKKTISDVLILSMNDDIYPCLELSTLLRKGGINTDIYAVENKSVKQKFKFADKLNVPLVVIIGENEINSGTYTLKNMATGEQWENLSMEDAIEMINYKKKYPMAEGESAEFCHI